MISPLSGIVSHFERVEDPEDDAGLVHCYVADHAFTPMNGRLDRLREGREGRSGGKGRSDIQAQASALSEGVERYSGVFQKSDPTINARAEELDGPAILPNSIQNFSARQIKNRSVEEAEAGGAGWVAEEFDAGKSIDWTPLWSLTEERIKYLPTANCFYGYGLQRDLHFARADSNGCAAGNTREEAVLQGFLELVERDAVALWWYNRLKRPGVDLDSFNDPWFGRIQQHYHGRGREIWLLDLTADMGIPTFAAISRVIDHQPEHLLFGYGCHFDVRLAASRAVTEVNQALALFPKKTPDSAAQASMTRKGFEWWPVATVADHPYLQPDLLAAPCRAVDFGANTGKDLHDDVTDCIARAKARGLEVLVLDQTRADTGLNVVRVVVPGLRHFWPRLAPGRLYDVPVQMGWLDQPNAESDLNPAHFFL
ncbi:MAG: YcaO-like family protein [Pseudomonadota bacterium]